MLKMKIQGPEEHVGEDFCWRGGRNGQTANTEGKKMQGEDGRCLPDGEEGEADEGQGGGTGLSQEALPCRRRAC